VNQAHDAVLVLAKAIALSFIDDGGRSYLAGVEASRAAAMAAIQATSLSSDVAASGSLEFAGSATTNRNKWNFG
jgi:hypothetical protein